MSISTPGSRNSIDRGVRPQEDSQELLAEISAAGSGTKPKLLFSRHQPASTWDRFVGWLTRPIQRMQAKARVSSVLKELGIQKNDSEISAPVRKLQRELATAGVFHSISMKTARDAFIDLMIEGSKTTGEFNTIFEQHLDQIQRHYEEKVGDHLKKTHGQTPALTAIRASVMEGLYVLLEFAKDPDCSLSTAELKSAGVFIDKFSEKGEYEDQLATIFDRYLHTFKEQKNLGSAGRIVEHNDLALPTPLQQKRTEEALSRLRATFRPSKHESIATFKRFLTRGVDLGTRENRQSLHEFLERFSQDYLKLDRETQDTLRPQVIRLEDALLAAQQKPATEKQQSFSHHQDGGDPWPEIRHPDWKVLADELKTYTGTASRFSPACATALIEYLTIRDRIHTLENENQRNEKKIASLKAAVGKTLEAQKLKRERGELKRSSRSQFTPPKKTKAQVRKTVESAEHLKEACRINAIKIASLNRQLVNPESMVRLAHVYESREELLKSMQAEKLDGTLRPVLGMLYKDLKAFMEARIPRN